MKRNINIEADFKNAHTGLWLFIGLVGSGKTTFAQKLLATDPKGTIRSSLDEIIQMISFYNYEPQMNTFYVGVERSTIIDGLLDGYKVIVDRTNITRKLRSQFIAIVKKIKEIAKEYLSLTNDIEEDVFIEQCERNLVESILIEESRKNVDIYSSFLKLVKTSFIRKKLKDISQTEIVAVYFDIPEEICIERRTSDPLNIVRDRVQKIDWNAVIQRMKRKFEQPDISEGFDRIYTVNHKGKVTKKT